MNTLSKTRIVKEIVTDIDKCTGCRACEMACSAFHSNPKYSSINPAKSRIRVVSNELNDEYVPIRAGQHTVTECDGHHFMVLDGKTYSECSFCRASCPSRDFFIEPDSGLPLKCDMCESVPPLDQPWCVAVCGDGALTYEEREVVREEPDGTQMEIALDKMAHRYGTKAILDALNELAKSKK